MAVVGESGSGKSVTALAILRLVSEPGRITAGAIRLDGQDLLQLDDEAIRRVRGHRIGMVFQEPMTSLNPVLSIGRQLTEATQTHLGLTRSAAHARAVELLQLVGIAEPERRLKQYPHHLSGGMRQRAMIAMALSCKPELIIADEPTTALDVTIQAQILHLMQDLCRRLDVALVIITHNLGVVARYADRVNVMYARSHRRTGHGGRPLPRAEPSLHDRPAQFGAAPGSPARCAVRTDTGQSAGPAGPAVGLHVSAAVQARRAALRGGHAASATGCDVSRKRLFRAPPLARTGAGMSAAGPLVEVRDLKKHFPVKRGLVFDRVIGQIKAVDGVSFTIRRGETFGLVGRIRLRENHHRPFAAEAR